MNFTLAPVDSTEVKAFVDRFNVQAPAAEIFIRRGITKPESVRFYLDHNLKSTHNPFLFEEMDNVVERLEQARDHKERVLVFGDRDVDGMTSIALMVEHLIDAGIETQWRLPMDDENYGISNEVVDWAHNEGITLIITVDCGITCLDEIDLAVELGIDVIVIDHHNPRDELPAAVAIIDPKVPDCQYPFEGLCAAALVSKVLLAWDLAKSPWYGQEFCLINLCPGNGGVTFEGVKIRNLIEVARLQEHIVDGNSNVLFSRVVPFLQGSPLFVYDAGVQSPLLTRLFGKGTDVYVEDLAPAIYKVFPELSNKSLLRMLSGSKLVKFSLERPAEIDVLKGLFDAYCKQQAEQAWENHLSKLGMVSLSIVADMMPISDENRIMLRRGLETLPKTKYTGIHTLMREIGMLQESIQAKDIGWRLTPILNSAGRLGKPDIGVNLLLCKDPQQAIAIVKDLMAMNEDRKKQGELALKRIRGDARTFVEANGNRMVIVRDDQISRGITGILANRIAREFNVPAIIMTKLENKLVGSMRTVRGLKVTQFLSQFEDSLLAFGGHDAAGGFSLSEEKFQVFWQSVLKAIEQVSLEDNDPDFVPLDIIVSENEMSENLWKTEEVFLPTGNDSPGILYGFSSARINEANLIGKEKNHLKLLLGMGSRTWPAVYWDAATKIGRDFSLGESVDIQFRLEKKTFGPSTSLQLVVHDMQRSVNIK